MARAQLADKDYLFGDSDLGFGGYVIALLCMPGFQPVYEPLCHPSAHLVIMGEGDFDLQRQIALVHPNLLDAIEERMHGVPERYHYGAAMIILTPDELRLIIESARQLRSSETGQGEVSVALETLVSMAEKCLHGRSLALAVCNTWM